MPNQKNTCEPLEQQLNDTAFGTPALAATPENIHAWWDLSMDASLWWRRQAVRPRDAAMLLCGMNPLAEGEPEITTTSHTGPRDFARLLAAFDDVDRAAPQPRSLDAWLQIAQHQGLTYHPWIDEWHSACASEPLPDDSDSVTVKANVVLLRSDSQDQAILAEIRKRNWNPEALPVPKQGIKGVKAIIRDAMRTEYKKLFQSDKVFNTAWQRLRNADQIKDEIVSL